MEIDFTSSFKLSKELECDGANICSTLETLQVPKDDNGH